MPHRPRSPLLVAGVVVGILAITGVVELAMGRSLFGPDGRFGWIETGIWSSALSQRVADWYSVTHVVHGFLFYGLLVLVARRRSLSDRFVAAVLIEAAWEVLENSPIIIDRYREATIAAGYVGDSILNSLSDILMMAGGFALAARLPVRASVALVLIAEVGLLFAIRDNLALNILMLLFPLDAIREWQLAGLPPQ